MARDNIRRGDVVYLADDALNTLPNTARDLGAGGKVIMVDNSGVAKIIITKLVFVSVDKLIKSKRRS